MTLALYMKHNHLSDRGHNFVLRSTYSYYLGPVYERQKAQPWGVWSLLVLL